MISRVFSNLRESGIEVLTQFQPQPSNSSKFQLKQEFYQTCKNFSKHVWILLNMFEFFHTWMYNKQYHYQTCINFYQTWIVFIKKVWILSIKYGFPQTWICHIQYHNRTCFIIIKKKNYVFLPNMYQFYQTCMNFRKHW